MATNMFALAASLEFHQFDPATMSISTEPLRFTELFRLTVLVI
jgi:hypothetical protein